MQRIYSSYWINYLCSPFIYPHFCHLKKIKDIYRVTLHPSCDTGETFIYKTSIWLGTMPSQWYNKQKENKHITTPD